MSKIVDFFKEIEKKIPILQEVINMGGIPYLVGGSVRDLVMEKTVKDFDIEIHKISIDDLQKCLKKFGNVSLVGKQFGVLKLHGLDVDWSLPRKDSFGRKPEVVVDPDIGIEEASRRRDVTINSMAIDLSFVIENFDSLYKSVKKTEPFDLKKELKIIDFYGGLDDIDKKRLKLVDKNFFLQDPLRFYRVMQFVGRFEMQPDDELNEVCKKMDIKTVVEGGELARERIYEEIKKLLLKSKRPSIGFRWLKKIGRLKEIFPELGVLVDIQQREDYHPEGDVFEHTMQVLDAGAGLKVAQSGECSLMEGGALRDEEEKFMIMLACLCHDFGKALKTDKEGGTKGHDTAGVPLAKKFLRRFTWNAKLIRSVCKLVRYHMMPLAFFAQKSGKRAYKRLALKLSPEVTARHLYILAWCDIRGRNKDSHEPLTKGSALVQLLKDDKILDLFLENMKEAKISEGPEKPVLQGRDFLDVAKPGPELGELVRKAYQIQIDEGITDKDILKKRTLQNK